MGTPVAAEATFANASSGVSAHYGIGEGSLHQSVSEMNISWHAGDFPMNQRSIGIEHSASLQTQIIPHNSVVATACPGSVNLHCIRDEVAARL